MKHIILESDIHKDDIWIGVDKRGEFEILVLTDVFRDTNFRTRVVIQRLNPKDGKYHSPIAPKLVTPCYLCKYKPKEKANAETQREDAQLLG